MRAVVYEEFGGPLRVDDVEEPDPVGHGVVVRVEAAGLCRSDWHGWAGHDPDIATMPHIPGHEMAGVIEAVGAEVTRWRAGDRVTVPFICACGDCPECSANREEICRFQQQPGFGIPGCFAEFIAIPHADVNIVALPDDLAAAAAAALGCRFATAYRAIVLQGRVRAGEWVAIHGCGGVGLSAVAIASRLGARVVAVDVKSAALDRARRLGAEVVIPAGTDGGSDGRGVGEAVADATGGGAHLSLDAVGSANVFASALAGLRRGGRHVQVGLLAGADACPAVPMGRVIAHELEILGSHGLAARHYAAMLEFVRAHAFDLGSLVARTVALADVPTLLPALDRSPDWGITVVTGFR